MLRKGFYLGTFGSYDRVFTLMENLVIAQHLDTLCYANICGNGYQPQVQRFELRNYVYL
jgi:hypothetical protein